MKTERIDHDYIKSEIARRLFTTKIAKRDLTRMATVVGIDPNAEIPRECLDSLDTSGFRNESGRPVYRGALEFQLHVTAWDQSQTALCRASYIATTADDEDSHGRAISVLGEAIISVQLLTWDEGDRDPEWINIDERVLPPIAVEKLAELVEEQVVEQEAEHLKNLS